jgi:hypothetical protein
MRLTVAQSKIIDNRTNLERPIKYSDVPSKEGWVYDPRYKPVPFDLMFFKIKGKLKVKTGWWTGTKWSGLRLRPGDEIIAWKRNYEL